MNITDENNSKKEVKALVPFSPSLLKSNIQKAVRRNDADKAIKSAKSLITLNETDALRRLMIIPIEDCLLPVDYDKLAAMLMRVSTKGGEPLTEAEKSLALSIIGDVARCEWRDLDVDNPDDLGKDYAMHSVKGSKENDLVNALLYRSRIGGSRWDYWMLTQMARVWNKRFAEGTWKADDLKQYFTGEIIDWNDVQYATVDDFLLESVDMHSSGILFMLLKLDWVNDLLIKEIPPDKRGFMSHDYTKSDMSNKELLDSVLWCCRSSINLKMNVWETELGKDKPVTYLLADRIPRDYWPVFEKINEAIKEETDNISRWVISQQAGVK